MRARRRSRRRAKALWTPSPSHALFDNRTVDMLTRSNIGSARSTSSVSHRTNAIMVDSILIGALGRKIQEMAQ